jgi:polyferredoxin
VKLLPTRRITQAFFLVLFGWLCLVSSPGDSFIQRSAWPVSWLLELDPLVALGSILATGQLEAGLLWALATVVLTLFLGRAFCGWICPLGTLNQIISHLGFQGRGAAARAANRPHRAEGLALGALLLQLGAAAGAALAAGGAWLRGHPLLFLILLMPTLVLAARWQHRGNRAQRLGRRVLLAVGLGLLMLAVLPGAGGLLQASLAVGLLDPLPLLHRSAHTVLLPLADRSVALLWPFPRQHSLAPLTALLLAGILLANLWRPRAFCRFLCPLGALLGLLGRWAPVRIAKLQPDCSDCGRCDRVCTTAADPSGALRQPSCTLCMSCVEVCPDGVLALGGRRSAAGERLEPDLSRRATITALAAGVAAVPCLRLEGFVGKRAGPDLLRPPGSLAELEFLSRCVACGQCMRVCPTNIIQPAGTKGGLETLFTPGLEMRIGTSGCQPSCTACGEVCPTGAIRALSEDEKLGQGDFTEDGPVRIGTAFVDRSRCLPWALGRPCIVCEEVCPTSPKSVRLERVVQVREDGSLVELEQPSVDVESCNGCGVCENACPVAGQSAIRVCNAGESRHPDRTLVL